MRKEKCKEKCVEKANSDTNKDSDNKSNSEKTSQNNNYYSDNEIFDKEVDGKIRSAFNENRFEKEMEEKIKNNQSSLTDVEEKKRPNCKYR